MPELKPCPFCGAAMRITNRIYADYAEWMEPTAIDGHDKNCPLRYVLWRFDIDTDWWTAGKIANAWNRRVNDAYHNCARNGNTGRESD